MAAADSFLSAPERVNADLRGSEVADAIGLGYRESRAALKRRLLEHREPEPPSEHVRRKLEMGKAHEPLAMESFVAHVNDSPDTLCWVNTTRIKRDYPMHGQTLAVTPDLEFGHFTVELKCTEQPLPDAPKAVHLAQCLVQMIAAGKMFAFLLYYQVHTARWQVFHLTASARIKHELAGWLREFAARSPDQLRMQPGEKDRRAERLLDEMWVLNSTFTPTPWPEPPTTAALTRSKEETATSLTLAGSVSAATRPEPGSTAT